MSVVSEGEWAKADLPDTAILPPATPAQRTTPPSAFPHGKAINGTPRTWTGRIVALDEWRRLTEWERHGPNGRHWCGISKQWKEPE